MEAKADSGTLTDKIGLGGLKDAAGSFASSLVNNGIGKVSDRVEGITDKLSDFTDGKSSGPSIKDKAVQEGIKAKVKGKSPALGAVGGALSGVKDKVVAGAKALTGGGGRGSRRQKLVNIVEWVDVGVPVRVAYNQWTEFEEWSDFMKKVENVERNEDEGKVSFKGQVFLSHRTWESQIKEMVPDSRIIWKSKGPKGHLDGAVTFHEYGPQLTKICAVVEYYPQGFFEKTAQIWRAVGRRVRVELKRYVRHVMTSTILNPDDVEGWRGEIRDSEIVRTHDEVVEEEQRQADEDRQRAEEEEPEEGEDKEGRDEGEASDEGEEEPEEEEPEDEYEDEEEGEGEQSEDEEEPEDEYDDEYDEDEGEDEGEEEPEDEYDDEGEEEPAGAADGRDAGHSREPSGSRGRR